MKTRTREFYVKKYTQEVSVRNKKQIGHNVLTPKATFHISANGHEEASATKKQIMKRKGVWKCL